MTWVKCPIGEETLHIADADVVSEHGVPQRVLVQFIRKEIQDETHFLSMPLAAMSSCSSSATTTVL